MAATEKQVRYLMHLLDRTGYSTRYMDASFKQLGARMRERSGTVEAWLRSRNTVQASRLIEQLKDKVEA